LGFLETINGLLFGAVIYGLAMGILSPTLNTWTIDLSNPLTKGKSIATMYIALEAGIGLGALFSGWYYRNNLENIPTTFYACSIIGVIGIVYLLKYKK
ncbi:MAG: MFS family permease, partial [Polaribacter sp.]